MGLAFGQDSHQTINRSIFFKFKLHKSHNKGSADINFILADVFESKFILSETF